VRLNRVAAVAAACLCLAVAPWPWALPGAVLVGGVVARLVPESGADPNGDRRLMLRRELPGALHLMAALLRAGCTDTAALRYTAGAVAGPLAVSLAEVARLRELGATAGEAWSSATADAELGPLAAAMTRRADTGSGVAGDLERLAAEALSDYFAAAQGAARAAAVRSVLPLAVCFLPAFLLLGVVPIVAAFGAGLQF
jgi:Flp pilus assembly protein TadB